MMSLEITTRSHPHALTLIHTYPAGSSAAAAGCGAAGWGRWEAAAGSEHGRLHRGEEGHRCHWPDLHDRQKDIIYHHL